MNRPRRPLPLTRFIYVIGPAIGLQKVGLATDPKARLATLQTACPFDLFLHLGRVDGFNQHQSTCKTDDG